MDCVTIILVTYNQEKYIYESIDSILMQDYENIQLIITDDASDYFDVDVVRSYVTDKKCKNLTDLVVLKNEKNLGTVKNLNRARKYLKGKYMMLLAGDDLLYDNKVLSNYAKYFSNDIDMIVSQVLHYDENMEQVMFRCLNDEQIELLKTGDNRSIYGKVCTECFIPAMGIMCSTEFLKKMGDYDERYYLIEDWPFLLKAFRENVRMMYADFVAAKHRDGGVSHNKKTRKEERGDRFHQDLINIIRDEVFPNYQYAEESMQKDVYNYANDRIVLSEYRSRFWKMTIIEKITWICKNKNLPAVFFRGCKRRIRFRKNKVHT